MRPWIRIQFLLMFLLAGGYAHATNYRELGIEQRRAEIKTVSKVAKDASPKQTEQSLDEERKLISEQLVVIVGDEDTKYTIVAGDTIQVTYNDQGKPKTGIYQVNSNGEIVMPLAGAVKLSGMNRGGARVQLTKVMAEYIRDPQLSIEINAAGKYTVLGAAGPGVYELQPNLTLLEAVIKAGYDTKRANLGSVIVMRGGREKPQILKMNLKKMINKGDRSDDIAIKPGDLIYIPNTFFYDFENFKDKVFDYILDYYTLGGSTLITQTQKQTNTTSE